MTLTEWVLDTIKTNWDGSFPGDLERVNRDNSSLLEKDVRKLDPSPAKSNYVGAGLTDRPTEPLATEGAHVEEPTVELRIVGLDSDEYGYVDNSSDFKTLVDDIKQTLRQEQTSPDVGDNATANIVRLYVENERPQSYQYHDHYLTDLDVRFVGDRDAA